MKKEIKKEIRITLFVLIISSIFSLNFITNALGVTNNVKFKTIYSEITVVMDDNYPPYIFKDSEGNLQGILVDQWKLWGKKTGIKVELNAMPWDKAQKEMKDGKYDVIDTIFESDERKESYDFSKTYAKIDVPIFFQNNILGITSTESLKGFNVAVKKGDISADFLRKNGVNNLTEYDSYDEIINAAKERKVSIFVMDKPPAQYLMYRADIQDKFNYSKTLYKGEFRRTVRKGDIQLLETVERGFSLISKNEYKEINDKWFGTTITNVKYYYYYLKCGVLIVAVLFLILLGLNRTLKNKVYEKTKQLIDVIDELRSRESENVAIIKAIPDYVFIIDKNGTFLDFLSESKEDKLYVTKDKFIGKTINEVFSDEISIGFMNSFKSLCDNGELQIVEYKLPIGSKMLVFEARIVNYNNNKILAMVRDITDKKATEEKIYKMSIFDVLTDLYNRNYFEKEIERFKDEKVNNAGIVICDVDGLKLINDSLGHAVGDEYLKDVAKVLRSSFNESDVIARIGGDEFAILIRDTTEEEIYKIKINIKEHLDKLNSTDRLIPISMSLGFAVLSVNNKTLEDVFKEADDYMYCEKLHNLQSGKGKNIEMLLNMLEARDFITQGHGERMEHLAALLAQALGMSDREVKEIALLAQFHDIGKIGIPDNILFKNGKLTDEERIIMNRHTEIGFRIAKSSPDLVYISDWILKHHEAFDGGGYPFGISKDEIPIQCRILSIVDAYDAMTNDRPYRKAIGKQEAIDEIKRCKGKQFDPILLEKFINIVK